MSAETDRLLAQGPRDESQTAYAGDLAGSVARSPGLRFLAFPLMGAVAVAAFVAHHYLGGIWFGFLAALLIERINRWRRS